jgi:hypothetical protein
VWHEQGTISAGSNQGQAKLIQGFDIAFTSRSNLHDGKKVEPAMRVIATSNDPVRLSFLASLLADAGIGTFVLDTHTSVTEGSIGAIQRRLGVAPEDEAQARRVLAEAGEL